MFSSIELCTFPKISFGGIAYCIVIKNMNFRSFQTLLPAPSLGHDSGHDSNPKMLGVQVTFTQSHSVTDWSLVIGVSSEQEHVRVRRIRLQPLDPAVAGTKIRSSTSFFGDSGGKVLESCFKRLSAVVWRRTKSHPSLLKSSQVQCFFSSWDVMVNIIHRSWKNEAFGRRDPWTKGTSAYLFDAVDPFGQSV